MATMPLGVHLEELRVRLIICLLAMGAAFVVGLVFRDQVMAVLQWPHVRAMRVIGADPRLKFQSYFEPIVAQMLACLLAALFVGAPVIIYEAWAFISPGLFAHERRKVLRLAGSCAVCFFVGVCFGYFVFVPLALRYLLVLAGSSTEPVLMVRAYVTTFFTFTVALGVAFQTPVAVYYLIRWGVVRPASLREARKGVILGAFVLGAVLTPPDPVTQIMMAGALIVLFDLGALAAAPSRATVSSFGKLMGVLVAAGVLVLLWTQYRPVARAVAVAPRVTAGDGVLATGEQRRLRRGAVCTTDADGLLSLVFGAQEGAVLHLAGGGSLELGGGRSVTLSAGELLVESKDASSAVAIMGPGASVAVAGSTVELAVPEPSVLVVNVFAGEASVSGEAGSRRLVAGQSATFRGGRRRELSEGERRWQERLGRGSGP